MTQQDIHPEDLLEASRHRALGGLEAQRLAEHLLQCEACRAERMVAEELDRYAGRSDDGALIDAAVGRTMAALDEAPARRVPSQPSWFARALSSRLGPFRMAALIPLALVLLGGVAYAALRAGLWGALTGDAPTHVTSPAAQEAQPDRARSTTEGRPRSGEAPELAPLPAPIAEEPAEEPPREEPATTHAPASPPASSPDAASLFQQASVAQRALRHRHAADLFEQLLRRFPESRESQTARVLLGHLLLESLGDLSGALRHCTVYERESPSGALVEEARICRAQALMRLGRAAQERDAWRALLDHHPSSVHAPRARQRLQELAEPTEPEANRP